MKITDLRTFFIKKMDRLLDLEELSKAGGSYWDLTSKAKNYFKTNLILLEKIDLSEIWETIPVNLKQDLSLYYNLYHNNLTTDEAYERTCYPKEFFWLRVNYGCYLFWVNFRAKNNRIDDF